MSDLMISISGVRGIVGDALTPETALSLAAAFAEVAPPGEILVASDGRTSGGALRAVCLAGLGAVGRRAIDLGIAPTPTTELAVARAGAAGAVIVTASHNPREWNGFKFVGPDGTFIRQETLDRLVARWQAGAIPWKRWDAVETPRTRDDAAEFHVQRVLGLDIIDAERCRRARLPVVLDTISASGGVVAPRLLDALGCRVTHLNAEPSGRFSRAPEPVPENIAPDGQAVRESKAAVGLVLDPDADRLALLDENGTPIGEEYTLALAVYAIRRKKPGGPVVVNVSTSRMIDDVGAMLGFPVFRTPVGEINVVEGMLAHRATLGGEGNGGLIYGDLHYGRDGILGVAVIVDLLAETGMSVSRLTRLLPPYAIVKQKLPASRESLPSLFAALRARASDLGALVDDCDGVKLVLPDRWVHLRPSNTEPIIRVIAEAPTEREALVLCQIAQDLVPGK